MDRNDPGLGWATRAPTEALNAQRRRQRRADTRVGSPEVARGGRAHDHQQLREDLELHLVELPKLQEAVAKNDERELVRWGKFLRCVLDASPATAVSATRDSARKTPCIAGLPDAR